LIGLILVGARATGLRTSKADAFNIPLTVEVRVANAVDAAWSLVVAIRITLWLEKERVVANGMVRSGYWPHFVPKPNREPISHVPDEFEGWHAGGGKEGVKRMVI